MPSLVTCVIFNAMKMVFDGHNIQCKCKFDLINLIYTKDNSNYMLNSCSDINFSHSECIYTGLSTK